MDCTFCVTKSLCWTSCWCKSIRLLLCHGEHRAFAFNWSCCCTGSGFHYWRFTVARPINTSRSYMYSMWKRMENPWFPCISCRCFMIFPSNTVKSMAQQDLLELLGPLRPPYRWLLIGPRRSGSTLHKAIPDGEYLLGTAGWLFQSSTWVNYNDLTATEPWNHG